MNYSKKLSNPEWQKKRLKVLERDNWTCKYCGDTETELHIHHLKYTGDPIKEPDENLLTACSHCHRIIESEKTRCQITSVVKFKLKDGYGYIAKSKDFAALHFGFFEDTTHDAYFCITSLEKFYKAIEFLKDK